MNKETIRVLLIEDLQMAQRAAEKSFNQLNCKLDIVALASKAFEKMIEENYDIIFADIQLPDINGLDFVQAVRYSELDGHRIPIVAVTSSPTEELKRKAKHHGCDDFIGKPLDIESVKSLLNKHLTTNKTERSIH